jgi:amidase
MLIARPVHTLGSVHTFLSHQDIKCHAPLRWIIWYDSGLATAYSKFRQSNRCEFLPSVKATWLTIEYLNRQSKGSNFYAKDQNITLQMRENIDAILNDADAIAMPTIPDRPLEINPDLPRIERIGRSPSIEKNMAPFDLTHHPAISVPCGTTD